MSILELPVDLWCSNTKNSEHGKLPSISQFLDPVSINSLCNVNSYFNNMKNEIKEDHLTCNPFSMTPKVKMLTREESYLIDDIDGGVWRGCGETMATRMLVIEGIEDSRNEEYWENFYKQYNFRWWNRPEGFKLKYFCKHLGLSLHDDCMCKNCYEKDSCNKDYPIIFTSEFLTGSSLGLQKIPWVNNKKYTCCCKRCFEWKPTDQNIADPIWCGKIDLVNKKAEGDWGWVVGPDTGFISTIRNHPGCYIGFWNIESEFNYLERQYILGPLDTS